MGIGTVTLAIILIVPTTLGISTLFVHLNEIMNVFLNIWGNKTITKREREKHLSETNTHNMTLINLATKKKPADECTVPFLSARARACVCVSISHHFLYIIAKKSQKSIFIEVSDLFVYRMETVKKSYQKYCQIQNALREKTVRFF